MAVERARAEAMGVDLLWRFMRNMKFPVVEALDDGSWRSVFHCSARDRRRSRGELPVRIVAYQIEGGGRAGEDPDGISFVHAAHVMRRRIINPGAFPQRAGRPS